MKKIERAVQVFYYLIITALVLGGVSYNDSRLIPIQVAYTLLIISAIAIVILLVYYYSGKNKKNNL